MALTVFVGFASFVHAQSPEEVLATFELHPDFALELVAMEPVIADPVDLAFDARGRAFVMEMPGYPFPEAPGHVVLIEDKDDDGIYESRTVFAEGFEIADSLMPYDGGILVASPPDLVFLKDTDGDDVADVREVLLSGFASGNQQHNFNGLQYGIDNWIYGANGGNGGNVYWAGDRDNRTSIARDDFRFHPPTKRFEAYGRSTGGFEITFDEWGRFFATHNLVHISHLVFPGKYLGHLPIREHSSLHENISDHSEGETARIFPIGVQETRVNHPEQSGYFSGACGITYYGGGAFPAGFENNAFLCDVVLNLIHRDVISPDGASLKASRARQRVDFLASTDRAFRPVNMTVGPDGALYVVDMHRAVIEHPEWIPDEIEANLDLNAGKSKGRIFRVAPKTGLPRVQPVFRRDAIAEVVGALAHSNKWWRDTAHRLLVEWQDDAAVAPLQRAFDRRDSALARLHAMWTLEGLDALDDGRVKIALGDAHAGVRENAIAIGEGRMTNEELRDAIIKLTRDPDSRIRMRATLAIGSEQSPPLDVLVDAAERDIDDRWARLAAFAGLSRRPYPSLAALSTRVPSMENASSHELVADLAQLVGYAGARPEIGSITERAAAAALPEAARVAMLEGLVDGLAAGKSKLESGEDIDLEPLFGATSPRLKLAAGKVARALDQELSPRVLVEIRRAGDVARDANQPKQARLDHLALFELAPYDDRAETLFALLDKSNPVEIQRAAIEQLQRVREPRVAERLIAMWDTLGRATLNVASDILLYQRENHAMLLDALESGDVPLGQMNLHLERRRFLLRSRDDDVRRRAEALFTDAGVVTRRQAIEAMRPALALQGDPARGKEVFGELCAQCHEIGGEGTQLGPSLTDIFRKSPETLLHDILDPNAAVEPEFISFAIETKDRGFYSGIVANETDETVTLREALGKETTVNRGDIKDMYSGGLSIMPEELESGMDHQAFADLLAFLLQPR